MGWAASLELALVSAWGLLGAVLPAAVVLVVVANGGELGLSPEALVGLTVAEVVGASRDAVVEGMELRVAAVLLRSSSWGAGCMRGPLGSRAAVGMDVVTI